MYTQDECQQAEVCTQMNEVEVSENAKSKGLRSIFRATAILSASSFVTILVGLGTSKVYAVLLGPKGYGYIGLLQSMMNLTVLLAGLGISSGLVKFGATRVAQNDRVGVANLWQAARGIMAGVAVAVFIAIVIFRKPLSVFFLNSPDLGWAMVAMSLPSALTLWARLNAGILNAFHRVEALAKNQVLASVLGGLFSVLVVIAWHEKGIIPAITGDSFLAWLVARVVLRKEVGKLPARPEMRGMLRDALALLKFGGPYTMSMLVGTGVQLVLPVLVLHTLGQDAVGYYRAAISVSVTYLGFIVTAMAQDYFPRVSAAADQPQELCSLINKQQRVILVLGVPVILGALALVPLIVPLVYSFRFGPTVEVLEWQLIGDIFKYSSWTMSYAILARCSSMTYFVAELVGGLGTLGASWLGMRWFGLTGLGISFVAAYLLYYAVVWLIIRNEIQLKLTKGNRWLLILAVFAGAAIRGVSYTSLRAFRAPLGLAFACIAAAGGIYAIMREAGETNEISGMQRTILKMMGKAVSSGE